MKRIISFITILMILSFGIEAQDKTAQIETGRTLTENFSPAFVADTIDAIDTAYVFEVTSLQRDYAVNSVYVTLDSIDAPEVSVYLLGSISGNKFTAFSDTTTVTLSSGTETIELTDSTPRQYQYIRIGVDREAGTAVLKSAGLKQFPVQLSLDPTPQ